MKSLRALPTEDDATEVEDLPIATRVRVPSPPADALLRSVFADSDSGILLLDPSERIAEINPAALRILALTGGRARGRPASGLVRTVVPGDDPIEGARRSARTEREAVLLAHDGSEIPVLLKTHRIGRPAWTLITLRDLTQSRRMQQELRRHERLATLGQLSAGVAHEIRNPLAGIGTSAQVLLRRFEPRDERARFVRVILDEVARLDRIVTSLLQYARPRTPELKSVPLAPCIDRVLGLSADTIQQAGIQVEVDAPAKHGAVFIDPDLITQVLLNVTLNAVQAMPNGGVLRYEVRRLRRRQPPRGPGRRQSDPRSAPKGMVPRAEYQQIRVSDTGAGIARGVLAQLFDPFFSTKPQGTGLGLSISQSIMQEHGGAIEVASREGHGTTVLLSFPVEKRHGERREQHSHARRDTDTPRR